eukprot:2038584-Rhodomonas_salina.1
MLCNAGLAKSKTDAIQLDALIWTEITPAVLLPDATEAASAQERCPRCLLPKNDAQERKISDGREDVANKAREGWDKGLVQYQSGEFRASKATLDGVNTRSCLGFQQLSVSFLSGETRPAYHGRVARCGTSDGVRDAQAAGRRVPGAGRLRGRGAPRTGRAPMHASPPPQLPP